MAMQTLALFFLVTLAVGGVAWVFIYPTLSGERKAEQRQERVVRTEPVARATNSRKPFDGAALFDGMANAWERGLTSLETLWG